MLPTIANVMAVVQTAAFPTWDQSGAVKSSTNPDKLSLTGTDTRCSELSAMPPNQRLVTDW